MEYTYYEAFVSSEHLLFAEEIQEALAAIGYSITANQIHALMRKHYPDKKVYYKTRMGLKKVYRLNDVLKLVKETIR